MRTKLLIFLLCLNLNVFGQRLPITGLCLQDVLNYFNCPECVYINCLDDCFTRANPAYFYPAYAVSGNCLDDFRNYGAQTVPTNPIYYIGHQTEVALEANPSTSTFTIPSDATFLVVCIKSVRGFYREGGIEGVSPNWNGMQLTQAGSYYGSNFSEIWYLSNPTPGLHVLSIPNTSNMHIVSSWYKSAGSIALHATGSASATSSTVSASVGIQVNTDLLIIDSVTYPLQSGTSLNYSSFTDNSLYFGVIGAIAGSSTQYKIYKPTSGTSYSIGVSISESRPWSSVAACFKSN